jgi:8-oxo-dGTP pyrophosphatase MutT (NUDIX family)
VSGGFRYLGEEVRDQGWRIRLVTATFEAPGGERFTRDVVRHPGAVAVVPVTDRGSALLVRQYRGAVDAELLEIPAGTRDHDGEPPEETARRELAEEVGVRATTVVPLCTMYNTPGFCDEETVIYLATGLTPCPTARPGPEEEAMTVHEVALADVDRLVADGTLVDGQTILGLLLARRTHLDGGAPMAAEG